MEQVYQYSILVHLKLGWVCHKVIKLTQIQIINSLSASASSCIPFSYLTNCLVLFQLLFDLLVSVRLHLKTDTSLLGPQGVFPVVPLGGRQPVSKWLETLNSLVKVYNSLLTTAINQQDQWLNGNCLCYIGRSAADFPGISWLHMSPGRRQPDCQHINPSLKWVVSFCNKGFNSTCCQLVVFW